MTGPALIRHSHQPPPRRVPQTRFEAWVAADRARKQADRLRYRYESIVAAGDPSVAQDLARELLDAEERARNAEKHLARFEPVPLIPDRWLPRTMFQACLLLLLASVVLTPILILVGMVFTFLFALLFSVLLGI